MASITHENRSDPATRTINRPQSARQQLQDINMVFDHDLEKTQTESTTSPPIQQSDTPLNTLCFILGTALLLGLLAVALPNAFIITGQRSHLGAFYLPIYSVLAGITPVAFMAAILIYHHKGKKDFREALGGVLQPTAGYIGLFILGIWVLRFCWFVGQPLFVGIGGLFQEFGKVMVGIRSEVFTFE